MELGQNYPNPANPTTVIPFNLVSRSYITLKMFDALGREVNTLYNGYADSGQHSVQIDVSRLTSGVYYYRISSGMSTYVHKLCVIR